METNNTLRKLVFGALIDLIDERMDPYSVKISYDDIVAYVIKKYIQDCKEIRINDIAIFQTINYFIDSNFHIENMSDFNTLLKMSEVQTIKFQANKKTTKEDINKLFKIHKEQFPFLFFDFDSENIQLANLKAWQDNKKEMQLFISQNSSIGNKQLDYNAYLETLKKMYEEAPEGYQMTMLHLFGIKYAEDLKNHSIKDLALEATGKDFLHVEIGKGIKLSKYVKIIDVNEGSRGGNADDSCARFDFYRRGIKNGDVISFISDRSITAVVVSDRQVIFEKKYWHLSPLVREIFTRKNKVNKSGAYQGPKYFTFRGIELTKLPIIKK